MKLDNFDKDFGDILISETANGFIIRLVQGIEELARMQQNVNTYHQMVDKGVIDSMIDHFETVPDTKLGLTTAFLSYFKF